MRFYVAVARDNSVEFIMRGRRAMIKHMPAVEVEFLAYHYKKRVMIT